MRGVPSEGDSSKSNRAFIMERLGHQAEVYVQNIKSKKGKSNLYTYIRSS
jgi:hypothetical protein